MLKNPEGEEVDRLLHLLGTAIRILGLPTGEIARRAGMTRGNLCRIFQGAVEVKMEHVLAISRAVGLAPGELFKMAYPRCPGPPSASPQAIQGLLGGMLPIEPESRVFAGISAADLPRKIQELVQQSLRDVLGGG
jgi:hypothetical protein